MKAKQNRQVYGYVPDYFTKIIRLLCSALKKILFLTGDNRFSNEFIQCLDPKTSVPWNGKAIYFRTGHGRLKWRADTFYTEEPLMIEWLSKLTPNDIFLDIGANVGTYTVPAAKIAKHVICAEMDPINVGILYENLFLNGLTDKVTIIPFGLGAQNSLEAIYYRDFSKGDALQSIARPSPFKTHTSSRAHKALQIIGKLDTIFDTFNLPQPNKIKIDVDGNERPLFEGGIRLITSADEIYFEDSGLEDSTYVVNRLLSSGFYITQSAEVNVSGLSAHNRIFTRLDRRCKP